jgi:hypothetical protein
MIIITYHQNDTLHRLCYVMLCYLSAETFPKWLEYLQVKPLYTNAETACTDNHRKISLLTVFSQIFGKFVYSSKSLKFKQYPCRTIIWINNMSINSQALYKFIRTVLYCHNHNLHTQK